MRSDHLSKHIRTHTKPKGSVRTTATGLVLFNFIVFPLYFIKNSPKDEKDDEDDTDGGGKMQCDDDEDEDEEEENEETHTTFTTESGHEVVLSVIMPRSVAGTNSTDTISRTQSHKPQHITSPPPATEIIWLPASHPPPPPLYSIKQQLNYSQV